MSPPAAIFRDSSMLVHDDQALVARAEQDGYLFFKKLLPAQDVLALRRDLLAVLRRHGWLAAGQDPLGGSLDIAALRQTPAAAMREDIGVSTAIYDDVQRLESVHRLPHHPVLVDLFTKLTGGAVLVHPRHIVRMVTPHPIMVPTPAHQDYPLIQGTSRTWTCWFPVGDCPRTMGPLTVLHQSHKAGYVPVVAAEGAGGIAAQLCPHETHWVEGDFEAGDVLTFPSYTIHKAIKPQVTDAVRLSLDVRYQSMAEEVEWRSLQPHCELPWEDIYAHWTQDDLKHYWRSMDLRMTDYDESLMQPSGRRIC